MGDFPVPFTFSSYLLVRGKKVNSSQSNNNKESGRHATVFSFSCAINFQEEINHLTVIITLLSETAKSLFAQKLLHSINLLFSYLCLNKNVICNSNMQLPGYNYITVNSKCRTRHKDPVKCSMHVIANFAFIAWEDFSLRTTCLARAQDDIIGHMTLV